MEKTYHPGEFDHPKEPLMNQGSAYFGVLICRQNSPTNFVPATNSELTTLRMDDSAAKALILSGKLLVLCRVCCHPFKDGKTPPKIS